MWRDDDVDYLQEEGEDDEAGGLEEESARDNDDEDEHNDGHFDINTTTINALNWHCTILTSKPIWTWITRICNLVTMAIDWTLLRGGGTWLSSC